MLALFTYRLAPYVLATLAVPFSAAGVIALLRKVREELVWLVAVAASITTTLFSVLVAVEYIGLGKGYLCILPIEAQGLAATPFTSMFEMFIDPLSVMMSLIVSFVGLMVVVFSKGYMCGDEHIVRYYSLLMLFLGGMLLLVLSGNFYLLYVGWEIVGLCSCLLIAHWHRRPEAARAGVKAFIVTRIGDIGLLTSIMVMAAVFSGNLSYLSFAGRVNAAADFLPLIIGLAFIGAVGKSAQLPLHVWLPDAMEGPTTVSALIHAATMVKAGVYLVARLETLVFFYPSLLGIHPVSPGNVFTVVAWTGCLTALIAATIATVKNDIKAVLAYSTISQLGYMFSALGVAGIANGGLEAWYSSQFHLVNHALFKALLFLSAGSVIRALETRDMRMMGGLARRMPITFTAFLIGALSLAGIPPFSGFWSKDEIVSAAIAEVAPVGWLLTVTSLLTSFYVFRSLYKVFLAPASAHVSRHEPREGGPAMTISLLALSISSLVAGLLEETAAPLRGLFSTVYLPARLGYTMASKPEITVAATPLLSTFLAFLGAALVYMTYVGKPDMIAVVSGTRLFTAVRTLLEHGYFFDDLYSVLVKLVLAAAGGIGRLSLAIDASYTALASLAFPLGRVITRIHNGRLDTYLAAGMVGAALIIALAVGGV